MFDWLMAYSSIVRASIIGSIIVGMIILVTTLIYFIKPKIKKENFKYFYAFSAGFVMIVGALGLLGAARSALKHHFQSANHPNKSDFTTSEIFIVVAFVILAIAMAGILIWGIKSIFTHNEIHQDTEKAIKRRKVIGIVMVLLHRVPASFVIGAFADDPVGESAALFAIILHIIPELMIVFYRQIEMGVPKKKAYINSILVKLIFFPLILIGNLLTTWTNQEWWFLPILYIMGGTFLVYASFAELTPEFSHLMNIGHTHEHLESVSEQISHKHVESKDVSSITKNKKMITLLGVALFIGIALATAIMFFHSH